jgi:hypothetical protein
MKMWPSRPPLRIPARKAPFSKYRKAEDGCAPGETDFFNGPITAVNPGGDARIEFTVK